MEEPMVDILLIEKILVDIKACVQDLREIQDISWTRYGQDKIVRRFIERTLHVAIEAMIDSAQHLISDEKWREPESYRDSFVVLAENGAISRDNLERYEKMAAFRNLLVHYYERIDNEIVFGILKKNLDDFELFISEIAEFLKQTTK